jgi:hypothetical protein
LYAVVHATPYLQLVLGGVALAHLWRRLHCTSRPGVSAARRQRSVARLRRHTSQREG